MSVNFKNSRQRVLTLNLKIICIQLDKEKKALKWENRHVGTCFFMLTTIQAGNLKSLSFISRLYSTNTIFILFFFFLNSQSQKKISIFNFIYSIILKFKMEDLNNTNNKDIRGIYIYIYILLVIYKSCY